MTDRYSSKTVKNMIYKYVKKKGVHILKKQYCFKGRKRIY